MASEFISLSLPQEESQEVQLEYAWCHPLGVAEQAPLMIFLHEGLGSLSMWRDFPDTLCQALRCRGLVYSRAGYGQSTPRPAHERWACDFMHRQAQEVLPALLQALQIDPQRTPVWLFGHSDGGSIALLAAAHLPAIQGVIVLAPHIFVEDISVTSIAQTRAAYLDPATRLRERLARHHDDVDSAFWGWNDIWLSPEFRHWRIDQELGTISCPVLAVQARDDEYGTLAQIEGIAQILPQCECLVLEACGHSPHKDQPDALIESVKRFFQQHAHPILETDHEL
jgi:pimeloyl-ACP methyl ester carboxylesterase